MKQTLEEAARDVLTERVKELYAVVDPNDGNTVVATASSAKDAEAIISTADLPPMSIKDTSGLKVVKTRKQQELGSVITESRVLRRKDDIKAFLLQNEGKLQGTPVRFKRYTPTMGIGSRSTRDETVEGKIVRIHSTTSQNPFTREIEQYPILDVDTGGRYTISTYAHNISDLEIG